MRTLGWPWVAIGSFVGCGGRTPTPPPPVADQPIAMCVGQTADATSTAHGGEMPLQLSPGFLDKMAACGAREAMPADVAVAGGGTVTAKGDCEWTNKVACHFHRGAEFVESAKPRPHAGELHCIVPTSEPKSPHVWGARFTCQAGTSLLAAPGSHVGETCGARLLPALATAFATCDARCCDDGTLTATTEARRAQGNLDVRPDFRMCTQVLELDCTALGATVGRTAYAPAFGAPIEDGI